MASAFEAGTAGPAPAGSQLLIWGLFILHLPLTFVEYGGNIVAHTNGLEVIKMMTVSELTKELHVCTKTVRNLVAKGMPCIKIGGLMRFDLDDVKTWLKENSK